MEKTIVNPPTLAPAVGFSHGILVTGGRLLFLAGQTGSNAEGQIMAPDDLVAQYEQTLRNLQTVVESAGGKIQDITKLNIYVRNRDDYLAHLKTLGHCASIILWCLLSGYGSIRSYRLFPGLKP